MAMLLTMHAFTEAALLAMNGHQGD